MAFEQRNNSGSMFRNDDKQSDNQPDYKGSALIDGVEYWVSGWDKRGRNGTDFISLSFRPKSETPQGKPPTRSASKPPQRAAQGNAKPQGQQNKIDEDDIPFDSAP